MLKHASLMSAFSAALLLTAAGPATAQQQTIDLATWKVPSMNDVPDGPLGKMVLYGHKLVTETYAHIGPEVKDPAMRFAGNNLTCSSCHIQGGTQAYGNPLVGVVASFPQYRPREGQIGSIEERVNGCMERSMGGKPMPADSKEMRAMLAYLKYIGQGIPVGAKFEGTGVKPVKEPKRAANPARGATVYQEQCAACHGEDGLGKRRGVAGDAQGYEFPPLWGPDSYNQGAGMFRLLMATQFVVSNMPSGTTHEAPAISVEDAYDAMAYVNDQPRPAKAGMEKDFPNRLQKPIDMPFGPYADSFPQTQHKYGPYDPIRAEIKELREKAKLAAKP